MQLEPKDLFEKLEFDKVLELLEQECLGALGVEEVRQIQPDTTLELIEQKLLEVSQFKLGIEEKDHIPLQAYEDLSEDLKMLEVEDSVLAIEGLQRINLIMRSFRDIVRFFTPGRQEIYPDLYQIIRKQAVDESLIAAIEGVIDEKGDIRPDASPELQQIRNRINNRQKELDKQFRRLIGEYKQKGWLSDSVESFRNGRRVLSVPSEHKRKIRGIIHDESATGKTAFIEPDAIILINNDIFDLEREEQREIYRILKALSAILRPYVPTLEIYQQVIIRFDVIRAKGYLAMRMNGHQPKLVAGAFMGIKEAYHPLLLLKNKQIKRPTIPFNLSLLNQNRILVLSGPNAGGKSILMKSVGLLQLMLQSGMLIPVDPESRMGIFKRLFADIGDQQSLEDDLSTYSSRLRNSRIFLEQANEESLVLIDEFGSGTDPKIGGAIAEAILDQLNKKKIFGVITTHYSNLKMYAFKTKGIVNGAMTFDRDSLSPTYQLKIGRPGSSFAFEIAHKSGLSNKVLKYARHRTGENEKAIDELLIDLQREKKEVEDKLSELKDREQKLERLIKNYEHMYHEMEVRRKKRKLEAKEQDLQQAAQENKEFERLIREIREEKNLEKAKALAAKVREERQELNNNVKDLRNDLYYKPDKRATKQKDIEVGDFVRLKTGGATGKVDSISKGKAIVLMGLMKMTANIQDLQQANEPLSIQASKGVKTDMISDSAKFESKIDIRGLRKEEAIGILETFVDKALVSSATNLRIIHGKGNGILRDAVKRKLKEYDAIDTVRHPEQESGGDGVTLVEFK